MQGFGGRNGEGEVERSFVLGSCYTIAMFRWTFSGPWETMPFRSKQATILPAEPERHGRESASQQSFRS